MGWNKEFRPPADYFPLATENPTPGGTITPGGAPICVDLTMAAGDSDITMTNQVSGLSDPVPRSLKYDTTPMRFIRVVIDDVKTVGAATARYIAKYANTKAEALAGTFYHPGIGATEVAASIAALGPSWTDSPIELDPAAIGDVLWHVFAIGGNGVADPVVSGVHIQFFTGMLDPCAGVGCRMPVGIYNGEDFSTYADEAAFLSTAEGNLKNLYWVWFGLDGSVEGASFDPDLLFCGNPVVAGRWKAVSSGSNIWDIVGYGSTSRFANPLLDNGGSGGGQLVRFRSVWTTLRFKIESGWTSDGGVGFLISELFDAGNGINGSCRVYIKAGRIVVITQADSSASLQTTDIGPASLIVGTSDFVEVTTHGLITDQGGGIWRIMFEVFVNPACSGGSAGEINTATPLDTYTADVVPTPIGGVVNNLGFYNWDKFNYTSTPAQWPEKKIWVAQVFYSGSLT